MLRIVHGQHYDTRLRNLFCNLGSSLRSIQLRHREIQNRNIRPQAHGLLNCIGAVRGLADYLPSIAGRKINPDDYKDNETRRLVDREFNLSYSTVLAPDNRVVSGKWFGDDRAPQISLEQGMAKRLNVKVGDSLRFDVAGQQIDAPVTSIRTLDWGTFRVNFFAVLPPAALAHAGALSKNGTAVINYAKVVPTFLFIFLAPLIGMVIGAQRISMRQ